MSKELEALSQIEKHVNCYKKDKEDYKEQFETLRKALTPPTAEEVCEALGKHYGENILYKDFTFYNERETVAICYMTNYPQMNTIHFYIDLPPHLITLIGRFYESVVE